MNAEHVRFEKNAKTKQIIICNLFFFPCFHLMHEFARVLAQIHLFCLSAPKHHHNTEE